MKFSFFRGTFSALELAAVAGTTVIFLTILLLWEPLFGNSVCDVIGPVHGMNSATVSAITGWWPLSYQMAHGKLFPMNPAWTTGGQGLVFPYLSLWLHGLLIKIFGFGYGTIAGRSLFPCFTLILLYLIYRKYLSPLISMTLSVLGLVCFADLPFRVFLRNWISGLSTDSYTTLSRLEISQLPFPSISLPIFLLIFLLSISNRQLTPKRITWLSVLWASQFYVHVLGGIYGLIFWFAYLPVRLKHQRATSQSPIPGTMARQILIAFLILSPSLITYVMQLNVVSYLNLAHLGLSSHPPAGKNILSSFYILAYFAFPLLGSFAALYLFKGDPKDYFLRFWPVVVLLCMEVIFMTAAAIFPFQPFQEMIFTRLSLYFFHFYYLVPPLYLVTRVAPHFFYGTDNDFSVRLRKTLVSFINRSIQTLSPILLVLLALFALQSATRYRKQMTTTDTVILQQSCDELHTLTAGAKHGATVAAQSPLVNLLIPLGSDQATLWINRFSSNLSTEEIMQRLALYWHLFQGGDESTFIKFMSPGRLQEGQNIDLSPATLAESGLGFWLAMHHGQLNPEESESYQKIIREVLHSIHLPEAISQWHLERVLINRDTLKFSSDIEKLAKIIYENSGTVLYEFSTFPAQAPMEGH